MGANKQDRNAHGVRRQAIRRKAQQRNDGFYARVAHWSFPSNPAHQPIQWHRERWILFGTAMLLTLLSGVLIPAWASAIGVPKDSTPHQVMQLPVPALPPAAHTPPAPVEMWHSVTVKPGQTLSDLFQAQGLEFSDLQRVLDATTHTDALRQIRPGDTFAFLKGPSGAFKGIRFDSDAAHRTVLRVDGSHLVSSVQPRDIETRRHVAHGVIHSSLFGAAVKAGLSEAMVVKLADVFKYDIDFIKDIRRGDSFTVIYNTVYRDGEYLHGGDIIAAEFRNHGQRYTAYRFKKSDGSFAYYNQQGRPLRKALLRTPVKFTRISSRFSRARHHPILGYTRAHKGVDYAAPSGTPIHAAGDGVIKIRGWVHGFGRFILLKNSAKYSTAYAHMSRFAKGLHVGSHVHQGQVIGYVGMTGLATGPHLHYEVRINGKQENPLKVTMPKPQPLPPKLLAQFKQQMKPMLARLNSVDRRVRLARTDAGGSSTH